MQKVVGIAVSLVLLSGCGTLSFKPAEYPLREGLIQPMKLAGTVTVSNAQTSSDEFIVYSYMGTKLGSNLKSITDVMAEQTRKELQKNGRAGAGGQKTIALKVSSLVSEYSGAMFYRSNIEFQAALGNGQTLDFKVPHKSGSPQQDLNGCIAEGVMTLLNDPRVRAYLAS